MERTIKQADLSNETNSSDQVTSRNNEETSFVQDSEVEGFPNTSNSEIESGFNRNINTVCKQKFDVDSILPSVLNYCNYIIEGTPIPMNSRQTDEFKKVLELLKGLSEEISQKDYLEYVNDWMENHKSEISIVSKDAPPIDKNLNRTNRDLEMRNKQNGETEVDNNALSMAQGKYGQRKQNFLMTKDLQSLTNNIARMEQNPSQRLLFDNSHMPVSPAFPNHVYSINDQDRMYSTYDGLLQQKYNSSSSEMEIRLNEIILSTGNVRNSTSMTELPQNQIPNLFSDSPVNDDASLSDSCFTSKEKRIQPESTEELQPNASVKRHSVYLNKVMQKSSTRKHDSNADTLIGKEEKKYACNVCYKSFKRKEHFNNHVTMHSDKRPFTCEVCNKKFKIKKLLKKHTNIHTEKKISCEVCNKSFSRRDYLKQHALIHSGETPYLCKICGKSFTHSTQLKRHKFTHTGEKPFDCLFCNKKFSREDSLNQHLITHYHK